MAVSKDDSGRSKPDRVKKRPIKKRVPTKTRPELKRQAPNLPSGVDVKTDNSIESNPDNTSLHDHLLALGFDVSFRQLAQLQAYMIWGQRQYQRIKVRHDMHVTRTYGLYGLALADPDIAYLLESFDIDMKKFANQIRRTWWRDNTKSDEDIASLASQNPAFSLSREFSYAIDQFNPKTFPSVKFDVEGTGIVQSMLLSVLLAGDKGELPKILLASGLDIKKLDAYFGRPHRAKPNTDNIPKSSVSVAAETETKPLSDDAEEERDFLGRGPLAISVSGLLHDIWRKNNDLPSANKIIKSRSRGAFVFNLDSPWGGGKTTFINYIAKVLNPGDGKIAKGSFLYEHVSDPDTPALLFLKPKSGEKAGTFSGYESEERRPWIIVRFNAWQNEHVKPPWWQFFKTIRKQAFRAVWTEGTAPFSAKDGTYKKQNIFQRTVQATYLHFREVLWWLGGPFNRKVLSAGVIIIALALVLDIKANDWASGQAKDTFDGVAALIAAVTGLGGAIAMILGHLLPGLKNPNERARLGGGDPFERFRSHFFNLTHRVRRPILVIIDDIDRCQPEAVVDLIAGMQTILRSPRVVYAILGDKVWLEEAFRQRYEAMEDALSSERQSFGSRFVEKAIQLSIVLPEPSEDDREAFANAVLGVKEAVDEKAEEDIIAEQTIEAVAGENETLLVRTRRLEKEIRRKSGTSLSDDIVRRKAREKTVAAAGSSAAQTVLTKHALQDLVPVLPGNPRQIKRIINTLSVYNQIAFLKDDTIDPNDPNAEKTAMDRWRELALWVILKTEYPKAFNMLCDDPGLAKKITQTKNAEIKLLIECMGSADALAEFFNPKLSDAPKLSRDAIIRMKAYSV